MASVCAIARDGSTTDRDEIDFDTASGHQQGADLHGGARRRAGEKLLPDLVEVEKIVEVGQKHLGLDHVIEPGADGAEGHFQVL